MALDVRFGGGQSERDQPKLTPRRRSTLLHVRICGSRGKKSPRPSDHCCRVPTASGGGAKYTGSPVAVIVACRAISVPQSQVSDRLIAAGRPSTAAITAEPTVRASRPLKGTRMRNRTPELNTRWCGDITYIQTVDGRWLGIHRDRDRPALPQGYRLRCGRPSAHKSFPTDSPRSNATTAWVKVILTTSVTDRWTRSLVARRGAAPLLSRRGNSRSRTACHWLSGRGADVPTIVPSHFRIMPTGKDLGDCRDHADVFSYG